MLFDEAPAHAVVLQHFATAQDMEEAAKVMSAMDPTHPARVSVDARAEAELKAERRLLLLGGGLGADERWGALDRVEAGEEHHQHGSVELVGDGVPLEQLLEREAV